MESWPEKKPHKNRFDNKPSGRRTSSRMQGDPLAFPAPAPSGYKKPSGKSTGRLLQVGCREGNFLLNVKNKFGAVYGVDRSLNTLKEAVRRHLPVAFSSGAALPYLDASFDFLVAFDAGNQMAAPKEFFAETTRVLKRGAEMIVSFPDQAGLAEGTSGQDLSDGCARNWPLLFESAGLEVYLVGTDALWASPAFPPVPSFSQNVFFAGLFNLFFLIEPVFPWQFGDNLVFWLKKK